jgi:hypothetical protein
LPTLRAIRSRKASAAAINGVVQANGAKVSPVLARTPHRALAGPYYRNVIGNLLAHDAFMGTAEQARPAIESNRIGIIAICRGNAETALLTRPAPAGLLAALLRGEPPDWLEKLPQAAGEPLEIYRVRLRS